MIGKLLCMEARALSSELSKTSLELKNRHVHFVGIGGCGMSGLARIVRARGAAVSGSDMTASPVTRALQADQIPVVLRQQADSIPEQADLIVISAAIRGDHPERAEAERRGLPIFKYAQMLGRLMLDRTGVAVAGTHGKSTTTAMLAHACIEAGLDPSFIVGATCGQIGGGCRVGRDDLLIGEACEYDRSFHNFHPTHAAILNVEEDHLDIYGTMDAILEAFNHFAKLTHPDGTLLIHAESAYRTAVTAGVEAEVQTIGYNPQADWCVRTIQRTRGAQRVTVEHRGELAVSFNCWMPGEHMAYNAAVAAVTAHQLGGAWGKIGEALSGFRGLDRRMQILGQVMLNGGPVTVVDDYGHHPTEIETTLRALRDYFKPEGEQRLICVFQPHQHSRTRFLLDQFAQSFSSADQVIVPHIYFVRDSEADRKAVTAGTLVEKLRGRGVDAMHIDKFEDIVDHLRADAQPGDLVVVMGAGPVWQVGHELMKSDG